MLGTLPTHSPQQSSGHLVLVLVSTATQPVALGECWEGGHMIQPKEAEIEMG